MTRDEVVVMTANRLNDWKRTHSVNLLFFSVLLLLNENYAPAPVAKYIAR